MRLCPALVARHTSSHHLGLWRWSHLSAYFSIILGPPLLSLLSHWQVLASMQHAFYCRYQAAVPFGCALFLKINSNVCFMVFTLVAYVSFCFSFVLVCVLVIRRSASRACSVLCCASFVVFFPALVLPHCSVDSSDLRSLICSFFLLGPIHLPHFVSANLFPLHGFCVSPLPELNNSTFRNLSPSWLLLFPRWLSLPLAHQALFGCLYYNAFIVWCDASFALPFSHVSVYELYAECPLTTYTMHTSI